MTETTIPPHQARVLEEAAQLDAKVVKLGEFFSGEIFKRLPELEQSLLREQYNAMRRYAAVLAARIALFDVAEA